MLKETLREFLLRDFIVEGGLAGHMSTPIDFPDFTGDDLKDLVTSIFSGEMVRMKEKLDGTNLNAYRNLNGDTVFIRNNTDLKSEKGGMSIEEMAVKWADKPQVADNFIRAAKTIEQVFRKVPVEFFNPSEGVKKVVNCECITAGQTNVMIYSSDRVAFHGTSTYTRTENGWELTDAEEGIPREIAKAAEGVKSTEPRPDLIIKSVEEGKKIAENFCKDIEAIFQKEGLKTSDTIDGWKMKRFAEVCPEWLVPEDVYRRWFYADKSKNMVQLKKKYAEKAEELKRLDQKEYKLLVSKVMEPLDDLILKIGNTLIENLEGFTNSGNSDISVQLRNNLDRLIDEIRKDAYQDELDKLERQIKRLESIDYILNSAEGVVFTYKGRLMKLTGSFSALNQIMGLRKFSR